MSLKRPAAGGETRKRDSLIVNRETLFPSKQTPAGWIALRRRGMMSLKRPAAGGETRKRDFLIVNRETLFPGKQNPCGVDRTATEGNKGKAFQKERKWNECTI